MDLTHTHIPMDYGTFEILYSQEKDNRNVMDPNGPNYVIECDYDVPQHIIEYDPFDQYSQEYCIDTLLSRKNEYKEKLVTFQGKELGSIKILKGREDKDNKECEKTIKDIFNMEPPSYPYIDNIPYINYSEGSIAFMWDKRKGKPKYDQKNNSSWLGPYIIKKKFEKDKYDLTSLDKRNIPLPVDGSLLQPYVQGT